MDSLILMAESFCRVDPEVSLHLTVPEAPASVRAWAEHRPQIELSTKPPDGVNGWDVKPWLLLQELNSGWPEAVWLDDDMIVTRAISRVLDEFPRDSLIVAEEWNRHPPIPVSHLWGLRSVREIRVLNACFIRATQVHRPLMERWLRLIHDPGYRETQTLPWDSRPIHLASDGWLLAALLESEDFGQVRFDYLRLGRHIAQCAGSSGYRPLHRLLDLFRGLPPLIHCIGRKPWTSTDDRGRFSRFLIDLATDLSPYVLASRRVATGLNMKPAWLGTRTSLGAILRRLAGHNPALAGLPLAIPHACHMRIGQMIDLLRKPLPQGGQKRPVTPVPARAQSSNMSAEQEVS